MTTYIRMTAEQRAEKEAVRRNRIREARLRQLRRMLYTFLCWVQEATTDLPQKIRTGVVDLFVCMICLILAAALFFACLGLFELALTFWGNLYFG